MSPGRTIGDLTGELFREADKQGQVAEAVNPPGNAKRFLMDGFQGTIGEERSLRPSRGQAMLDVTHRLFRLEPPQQALHGEPLFQIRVTLGEFAAVSVSLLNLAGRDTTADDGFVVHFRLQSGVAGVMQSTAAEVDSMLLILAIILLIAWLCGFLVFHVTAWFIHLIVVIAVILFILHFVTGRRTV